MSGKTKRDIVPFKAALEAGKSMGQAMQAAGFPVTRAKRGKAGLPKEWRGEVDRLEKLAEKGKAYDPQQRAAIARGALLDCIDKGKDVVQAAAQIGKDKEVGMWVSEQNQAVVILQPPASFLEEFEAARKTIEGEIVNE